MKSSIPNSLLTPTNSFYQRKYFKLNTSTLLQKLKKDCNKKNKNKTLITQNNKTLVNEINSFFGSYKNNANNSIKNSSNKKTHKKFENIKNTSNKINILSKFPKKNNIQKKIEQVNFSNNNRRNSSNISNGANENKKTEKNFKTVLNKSKNNDINKLPFININNKLCSINEVEEELLNTLSSKVNKLVESKINKQKNKNSSLKKTSPKNNSRNISRNFLVFKEKESNDVFNIYNINYNNSNNQISKISKFSQENTDIVNYKTPEKSSIYVITKSNNSNNISFNIINNSKNQTTNCGEADYVSSNNSNLINRENFLIENQKNYSKNFNKDNNNITESNINSKKNFESNKISSDRDESYVNEYNIINNIKQNESKEIRLSEIQINNINNGTNNNSNCLTLTNISKLTNFLSDNDMYSLCSTKKDENGIVQKNKKNDKKYKKKVINKNISSKEKIFDDFIKYTGKEKNENSEIKIPNKYLSNDKKINLIISPKNNNILNYEKYVNYSYDSDEGNTTIKKYRKNCSSDENNRFIKKLFSKEDLFNIIINTSNNKKKSINSPLKTELYHNYHIYNSKYINSKKSIINTTDKKIIYKRKHIKSLPKNKKNINISESNSQINQTKRTDYVKKLIHGVYDDINLYKVNFDLERKKIHYSSPNKNKNCTIIPIKKNKVKNNGRKSCMKLSEKIKSNLFSTSKKNSPTNKFKNKSCINIERKINVKNKIKKSDSCKHVKINGGRFSIYDITYSEKKKIKKNYNNLFNLKKNNSNFNKVLSFRKIISNKNNSNDLKYVNYYQILKKIH